MDDNSSVILDKAYDLHKSGKLVEAKFLYEKLYSIDPLNLDLLNLYAQLNTSTGDYDLAIQLFSKLYSLTKLEDAKVNIAKVYAIKNDFETAISIIKELNSDSNTTRSFLVHCYLKLEKYEEAKIILLDLIKIDNSYLNNYNLSQCYKAEKKYQQAINQLIPFEEEKSDNLEYLSYIGGLYRALQQPENELFYLQKIGLLTNNTNVLKACAIIAENIEKYDLALFYLNKILDIVPNHLEAMINIANVYKNIDLKISYDLFKELHENNKDNVDILIFLSEISIALFKYDDLEIYVNKLSSIEEIPPYAYCVLANSYYKLYKYEKSLKYWELSIKHYPDIDSIKAEYAEVLSILGRTKEAREITSKILHIPNAARTYAETFIRNRDFEPVKDLFLSFSDKKRGLCHFLNKGKYTYHKMDIGSKYNISEQEFYKIGEDVYNKNKKFYDELSSKKLKDNDYISKKLLIYSGQGAGDVIMNLRYLNYFSNYAENITLSVPTPLYEIVKYNFPMFKDIRRDMVKSVDEFDYVTTYLALIYNLNLDLKNIPFSSGFLNIKDEQIKEKSKLSIFNNKKKKVGIFWQGNPTLLFNRSAKLSDFSPLIQDNNIQLYSFQLEDIDEASKEFLKTSNIIDLAPYIKNYVDTAALLFNVDVLITIDTSIAHLAGALGIKTYLMLPFDAEWRWFHDTKTTPWYDSVRIFKQKIPGDWNSVVLEIKNELDNG